MDIRAITSRDFAAVASIDVGGPDRVDIADVLGRLAESFRLKPALQGLVAVDGDSIVGVALYLRRTDDQRAWDCLLVVSARQGAGKPLKSAVIDAARGAGGYVVVSSVHEDNERMLRLNQRLGADITTDRARPTYRWCTIPLT